MVCCWWTLWWSPLGEIVTANQYKVTLPDRSGLFQDDNPTHKAQGHGVKELFDGVDNVVNHRLRSRWIPTCTGASRHQMRKINIPIFQFQRLRKITLHKECLACLSLVSWFEWAVLVSDFWTNVPERTWSTVLLGPWNFHFQNMLMFKRLSKFFLFKPLHGLLCFSQQKIQVLSLYDIHVQNRRAQYLNDSQAQMAIRILFCLWKHCAVSVIQKEEHGEKGYWGESLGTHRQQWREKKGGSGSENAAVSSLCSVFAPPCLLCCFFASSLCCWSVWHTQKQRDNVQLCRNFSRCVCLMFV